jgi:hypothetical protein
MASDHLVEREYTLKVGSHTWIDGKTYTAGTPDNKMMLTREQMERIGKERFEGQSVESQSNDLEALRQENRQLREQLAQMQSTSTSTTANESYTDFLNRPIPEISADLKSISDPSILSAIQAEENKGGQPRVGVLKAIEQRREELG